MANNIITYQTFTVDTVDWTAIQAPIDCEHVVILNLHDGDVTLRSDVADAATEKTLPSSSQEVMTGGPLRFRFPRNTVPVYAKAVSGTGTVHVGFML